jgi:hypothetical protein
MGIYRTLKTALALVLALGLYTAVEADEIPASDNTAAKETPAKPEKVQTIEEIVVKAVRQRSPYERPYVNVDGKRFFEGPYGDYSYILAIGQELKNRGDMKRIFTRRIAMPHEYASSSLDQYDYPLADDCGIDKFKFYDGGGKFMALGYVEGKKEIIFDVLIGGGPFSAPGIWGPYDQILGKRHKMKLIMGNAAEDGMGNLKSGYAIGLKAALPGYELRENGRAYSDAVEKTGKCLADKIDMEAARRLLSSK